MLKCRDVRISALSRAQLLIEPERPPPPLSAPPFSPPPPTQGAVQPVGRGDAGHHRARGAARGLLRARYRPALDALLPHLGRVAPRVVPGARPPALPGQQDRCVHGQHAVRQRAAQQADVAERGRGEHGKCRDRAPGG